MLGAEEIIVGKENITKDVWTEFADMYRSELANAEDEQIKLMQAEKRISGGERKNFSFGRVRMKVCPEVFYFWEGKLGQGIWKDKSFLNWIEKRFGNLVKIKSVSAKVGI
jgi:hypothetical protein